MNGNRRTRRAGTTLTVVVVGLAVAGCFEHRYTIGAGAPHGRLVYNEWHHHWIAGLISPDQELKIQEICPSGNATIHEEVTFLNGLIHAAIGGLYSPTTVKVWCDDNRRSELELELTEEDVARIVADPAFLAAVEQVVPERLQEVADARQELDR